MKPFGSAVGSSVRTTGLARAARGVIAARQRSSAAFSRSGGSAAKATGFVPATQRSCAAFSRSGGSAAKATGFTLIEVIVAFAVLALALTLLLGTLSGAARQVRWADEAGRAALHAQSLLDQTGVGEPLQPGQREGEFEDGRYRWSLQVEPWHDPGAQATGLVDPVAPRLMHLTLAVQWGDGGPRQQLQLQSLRLVAPDPRGALSLP